MMIRRHNIPHSQSKRRRLQFGSSPWKAAADVLAWIFDWRKGGAWTAAALGGLLFFYAVAYAFPHARQIAMQRERGAIERESRTFCEKHGMPFGTREYTVCAEDLMDIRANARQRTLDELGII